MNFDPEFFTHLEVLFGSVGVVISIFFGIFILFIKNNYSKANYFLAIYFLAYGLRSGKSLFYKFYTINSEILTMFLGALLLIGPSLWFYSRLLTHVDYTINKKQYLLHYLPFFLVIVFSSVIPNNGESSSKFLYFGLALHGLTYGIVNIYRLYNLKYQSNSIVEIKIKKWLIALTIVTILMFIGYLLIFFSVIPYAPYSSYLFSGVVVYLTVLGIKNSFLFKSEFAKYSNSKLSDYKAKKIMEELNELMDDEKPYLDSDLTLIKLSDRFGITSKQLSQVINQVQNKNYSQYIANYRIIEAKKRLLLKEYKNYKIAIIAYESGFNNISSFNANFKRVTNTTAIEFRKTFIN